MSVAGAGRGRTRRITGLVPEPGGAGSVRIEVNGERFASVAPDVVRARGLVVGREIDEVLGALLGAEAETEAAYRTALRSIERRPFAQSDLARRLLRKGHAKAAVDAAVMRAAERGYLDDIAFAVNYVDTRAARGRGPLRLARDLMAMGVERGIIDRAIADHFAEAGDRGHLPRDLAAKRVAQLRDLPRPVKRRRVLAYLARRGFSGRDITELVGRLVG